MFRIGDFSRIARVSARLLRFYDENGLLQPAHADPATGYRWYSAAQLPQLNRILVLKELGLSLEQIAAVMRREIAPAELRGMLLARRHEAERVLAAETERLRQIETRIAQIESDGALTHEDVVLRSEPARRLLSLRRVVPSFAAARALIGTLRGLVRTAAPAFVGGQLVAVAHAPAFEHDEIDVEFGVTLPADATLDLPADCPLTVRDLAAVPRLAACVRVGLPEDAHLVTARIGRFVEATGHRLDGPSREVFLAPPIAERMHEAIVEMQFPLRPLEDGEPAAPVRDPAA